MPTFKVLVVGAGIAGSISAYWLGKAGAEVMIIERSADMRKAGQGIDVRGKGLTVVQCMGVEEEIRSRTTEEKGIAFVDESNRIIATFDASDEGGKGFTSEIEIMRGDLTQILFDASTSMQNVKHRFGCDISSFSETSDGVTVKLSTGETEHFDIIIGADGLGSRVRKLMLGPEQSKECFRSLNGYVAYFSVPTEAQDGPRSRCLTLPGRRNILIRPKNKVESSAYMGAFKFDNADEFREAASSRDIQLQKRLIAKIFDGVGWETDRLLNAMEKDEDFYFQHIAQIKLDPASWHRGRCVLVGDAASSPSPITGMGTTVAVVGAYVLACEIGKQVMSASSSEVDFEAAFKEYSRRFGPYVKEAQSIPLGGRAPLLVNPETSIGVWVLRTILWIVCFFRLPTIFGNFIQPPADKFDLPDYGI